jgi:hypothetical protein
VNGSAVILPIQDNIVHPLDLAYTTIISGTVYACTSLPLDVKQARLFLGNWSEYKAGYKERYGKFAEEPQRIKYRTLKRR